MTDISSSSTPPSSFRWLLATRGAENLGDSLSRTLMPIMAVAVLGAGTAFVGVLNSLSLAMFLLLGTTIGHFVDRLHASTRIMTGSTLARALALGAITVLYLTESLNRPALLAFALVIGVADVCFTTAETTLVPQLVQEDRLKWAYSSLAVTGQATSTTAALLASVLLGWIGLNGLLISATTSYVASVLSQSQITIPLGASSARRSMKRPRGRSITLLFKNDALRALTLSAALTNAGVMLGNTVLPVFVLADLGIEPAFYAAMGIVSAIGAIAGSALSPTLTNRWGLRRLRVGTALVSAPAVLLTAFCTVLPGPEIIWLMLQSCLWNFLVSVSSVAGADVLPRSVPREQLASVSATQRTITLGIMPITALVGGIVATYTGTQVMILVWAALAILAALPMVRAISLDSF